VRLQAHTLSLAALLLAAVVSSRARAADGEWQSLAPGLWYRPWRLQTVEDAPALAGHAFRVDPRVVHMTMLDARQGGRRMATAATLREESQAYLVVNGGFFDEHEAPLGLVVGDGKQTSPLRKVDQGVFLLSMGKPSIQHTRDPLPAKIDMAVQVGPRLVVDGRAMQLKRQVSRRTSICVPGDGTVIVVVFPTPISLADLAAALVRPQADGGLGCWSALNLDGGPSTQLSVATPGLSLEIEGGSGVPNGLAILPRSGGPSTPPP